MDGPAAVADVHLDLDLLGAKVLKVWRPDLDGPLVHKLALGGRLVLPGEKLDDDVACAEAEPGDGDLGAAHDGADEGREAEDRVGGPHDRGDVGGVEVPEPPVGPAAKDKQLAPLGVVDPGGVLAGDGDGAQDLGGEPAHLPHVDGLHLVHVVHHALLAAKGKDLVVGDALDAVAEAVGDVVLEVGGAAGLRPGHGLDVEHVALVVHLRVVAAAEDDVLEGGGAVHADGEQGRLVVEAGGREDPLRGHLDPLHAAGAHLPEVDGQEVVQGLPVASVAAEDQELVGARVQRGGVVGARQGLLPLDVDLGPLLVLHVEDPDVVVADALVEAAKHKELRGRNLRKARAALAAGENNTQRGEAQRRHNQTPPAEGFAPSLPKGVPFPLVGPRVHQLPSPSHPSSYS